MRRARAFEAVKQEQRRMIGFPRMPVAMCQDARIGCDVDVLLDRWREIREPTAPGPGVERLLAAADETRPVLGGLKGHTVVSAYHPAHGTHARLDAAPPRTNPLARRLPGADRGVS